jgi:hypothetical protein
MNPTFNDVSLERIDFRNYGISSNVLIDRTLGIERNNVARTTYIPNDAFIVSSTIQSLTSMTSPTTSTGVLKFTGDLDGGGQPKVQTKAFTDEIYNSLGSYTFPTITVTGTSTLGDAITMNGSTAAKRTLNLCYLTLKASDAINSTNRVSIYHSLDNLVIDNLQNSGTTNFIMRDEIGTQSTTLSLVYGQARITGSLESGPLNVLGISSHSGNSTFSTLSSSGLATLNSLAVTTTSSHTGNSTFSTLSSSGLATLNSLSITNASGSQTVTIDAISGFKKNVVLDGTLATDRQFTCCYMNLFPIGLTGNGSRMYHGATTTMFFENLVNSSLINFAVRDAAGTTLSPLIVSFNSVSIGQKILMTGTTASSALNIENVGQMIFENSTNGKITQTSNTFPSDYSYNIFKKSSVRIKQSNITGSSSSAFEILDEVSTIRGFIFIPNAATSSYNLLVGSSDDVITTRVQNGAAITIAPWSTIFLGLRIHSSSSSTGSCTIRAASNIITVNETSITMNQSLDMIGTTSVTRKINNISTLQLFDINGVAGKTCEMSVDNNVINIMSNLLNGYFAFSVKDLSSVVTIPFTIAPANTSVLNTFIIRFAGTTSTRVEVTQSSLGICEMNNTNSSSLASEFRFKVQDTSAVVSTPLTINSSSVTLSKPLVLPTPSSLNFIGYVYDALITSTNYLTSANIRNITTYQIPFTGTYLIMWKWRALADTTDATMTALEIGVARSTTNSFDFYTPQYISYRNLLPMYSTVSATNEAHFGTQCTLTLTQNNYIYFNCRATWTGSPTYISLGGYYTITRLA